MRYDSAASAKIVANWAAPGVPPSPGPAVRDHLGHLAVAGARQACTRVGLRLC